jgi:hypothetical protein
LLASRQSVTLLRVDNEILGYRSALDYNREVFLLEHGELVRIFSAVDINFGTLIEPLRTMRDANGHSYPSFIPFVAILQRQSRAAFEAFAAYQSYQGWVLLRPGIEAVLIIGKWTDNPANAKIWENREQKRKDYRKAYEGKALRSESLPSSDRIQDVLSKVNDDFVHANPDYYSRHLKFGADDPSYVSFRLEYFDEDDKLLQVHVLAFLNLLLVMQESLASLFSGLFNTPVALRTGSISLREQLGPRIKDLASKSAVAAPIFQQLGLLPC